MKWQDVKKELLDDLPLRWRIWYHVSYWFESKWLAYQIWLNSHKPCHKESLGYTCHHRVYPDGTKECGN